MQVVDRQTERLVALDAGARDFLRLVGGIVEHLNVEQFARIIEARDRVHQALDHVALVVDRKLYGNLGPLGDRGRRAGDVVAILEILVHQEIAVQPVRGQDHQDDEIRNHDGQVKRVELVEAAEGIAARVGELGPIIRERALRRHCKQTDRMLRENQNGKPPLQKINPRNFKPRACQTLSAFAVAGSNRKF